MGNASLHAKVFVFDEGRLLLATQLASLIKAVRKHFRIMILNFRGIEKAELAAFFWIRRKRGALVLKSQIAEDSRWLQQSLILLFMHLALLFLNWCFSIDPIPRGILANHGANARSRGRIGRLLITLRCLRTKYCELHRELTS